MNRVPEVLRGLALKTDQIAARSHLSPDRVRELLGGSEPSLSELRALAHGLRVPLRVFATGKRTWQRTEQLAPLFRGFDSRDFEPSVEAVAAFVETALQLLPKRQSNPAWLRSFAMTGEIYEEAHKLASLFRATFLPERQDEPLIDLPQLLVDQCDVILARLHYSRYEGASLIAGGYCFIFVSPRFAARMLFTVAHELGHILAHRDDNAVAVFERTSQIGPTRRTGSRTERFVDAFASVLLLPDRGVGRALSRIRSTLNIESPMLGDVEILLLARIFGVSFETAARRCEDLDLLPEGGALSLADQLKKDFGNPEKRATELGLPPRPDIRIPKISHNLVTAAVQRIQSGEFSAGWVADHLGISVGELFATHAELTHGNQLRH
jgi:Zn-dependent peptidase ImmA (M78 family)/transcriptional regulator with XRE-family HTH domain